eukprot:GDKI01006717.1.p1 GENE.GDKI01006717.1~~GDKI01006717.1.p1  ORF type:complete len:121 (+),score=39.59 GDKI01006717.1:35-397(+)
MRAQQQAPPAKSVVKPKGKEWAMMEQAVELDRDAIIDPNWQPTGQMPIGASSKPKVVVQATVWDQQTGEKRVVQEANMGQKKKHQINWLAQEAMNHEAEYLERTAHTRLSKAHTAKKYGW